MDKTIPVGIMDENRYRQRDALILEIMGKYMKFDFSPVTELRDIGEKDEVISGLLSLGGIFKENIVTRNNKTARINAIIEVILKFIVFDFSMKAPISENGDEIDAIAAGLNTLGEELEASRAAELSHLKQLEFSNKELDAFTYSVSHDLRAPLRAINGFSKILKEDYGQILDEDGNRKLNVVMDEARKMGKLIDDLLALSRIGRKGLEEEDVNMTALAESVASTIENPGNTKIIVNNLLPAFGDVTLLRQVFINLVSNAIKYSSPKPHPKVEIGSFEKDNEQVYYVMDNGVGFDMAYANKLFQTFQRLHGDEEFEGTGIGLVIVKRIIEHHKGRVWVEAKENKGAAFYFSLPKNLNYGN